MTKGHPQEGIQSAPISKGRGSPATLMAASVRGCVPPEPSPGGLMAARTGRVDHHSSREEEVDVPMNFRTR
ncbi:hypothetical protein GCM10023237_33340 [Streptomyces coeruleoprunus]